jgi:hypothetical protein
MERLRASTVAIIVLAGAGLYLATAAAFGDQSRIRGMADLSPSAQADFSSSSSSSPPDSSSSSSNVGDPSAATGDYDPKYTTSSAKNAGNTAELEVFSKTWDQAATFRMDEDPRAKWPALRAPSGATVVDKVHRFLLASDAKADGQPIPDAQWHHQIQLRIDEPTALAGAPDAELIGFEYDADAKGWRMLPNVKSDPTELCQARYYVGDDGFQHRKVFILTRRHGVYTYARVTGGPAPATTCDGSTPTPTPTPAPSAAPTASPAATEAATTPPAATATPQPAPAAPALKLARPPALLRFRNGRAKLVCRVPRLATGLCAATLAAHGHLLGGGSAKLTNGRVTLKLGLNARGRRLLRKRRPRARLTLRVTSDYKLLSAARTVRLRRR